MASSDNQRTATRTLEQRASAPVRIEFHNFPNGPAPKQNPCLRQDRGRIDELGSNINYSILDDAFWRGNRPFIPTIICHNAEGPLTKRERDLAIAIIIKDKIWERQDFAECARLRAWRIVRVPASAMARGATPQAEH